MNCCIEAEFIQKTIVGQFLKQSIETQIPHAVNIIGPTTIIVGRDEMSQEIPILSEGQTVFNLSNIVVNPELSHLICNHNPAIYGQHYMIDGSVLTRLPANGYTLDSSDYLYITYYTS